jgi:hypothetical protein
VNINIVAPHAAIKLPLPPLADTLKQSEGANTWPVERREGQR